MILLIYLLANLFIWFSAFMMIVKWSLLGLLPIWKWSWCPVLQRHLSASLSGVDVRCKVLMWIGHWALRATMCVWIHQAVVSVMIMEAETVSKTLDTNSVFVWLIVQEDWPQKPSYCNTSRKRFRIQRGSCHKDEWLLNCTEMLTFSLSVYIVWDLRFSDHCWWILQSSGTLCHVDW
jgi:hypothetical protein